MATPERVIVWFRNDLRVHDNPVLSAAAARGGAEGSTVVPVYCFDPRTFGETPWGSPKTGGYRARFLLESVAELRRNLRELGSDLLVAYGEPEQVLPSMAKALDSLYAKPLQTTLIWQEQVASEELAVDAAVRGSMPASSTAFEVLWGGTLYEPRDLPFEMSELPNGFTAFRKLAEASLTLPISHILTLPISHISLTFLPFSPCLLSHMPCVPRNFTRQVSPFPFPPFVTRHSSHLPKRPVFYCIQFNLLTPSNSLTLRQEKGRFRPPLPTVAKGSLPLPTAVALEMLHADVPSFAAGSDLGESGAIWAEIGLADDDDDAEVEASDAEALVQGFLDAGGEIEELEVGEGQRLSYEGADDGGGGGHGGGGHGPPKGAMAFHGGEGAALKRLKHYLWDKDCLGTYFETRNGMLGADYSSKFSPWLSHGCLSPRFLLIRRHPFPHMSHPVSPISQK